MSANQMFTINWDKRFWRLNIGLLPLLPYLFKMKKTLTLIIGFIMLTASSKAQKWTEMMQDPNANFYDIVKEFDNYWKDKPYERGKGYKAFRRWQWYMEPRVFPSGDLKLGSRAYAFEQYQNFLQESTNNAKGSTNAAISATTANWSALGPFGSPTNGDAGRVQVIRMHPVNTNTFYVGTAAGGFWITNNGGTSYTTTTDQFGSCGVSDIAINTLSNNIMYISTGDKDGGDTHSTGVMKSTDGGQTWSTTGLLWLASQQRRIYRLLINPVNPKTLIAATTIGMFQSWDSGATWSLTANGSYVDAEYRPGDTTVVHAVTNGAYVKSTNGGLTYSGVPIAAGSLNSNRLSLAVTAANSNYVYILVSNTNNGFGGLYRSTDSGTSFSLMSSTPNIFDWSTNGANAGGQGWYDIAIDASPANANEITAGGVNSWKSTTGGSTWVLNTHWTGGGGKPYVHADLHYVLYASGTTCFLGTDGGVARTTNSGANFSTINGNMNIAEIYKMGLSASNSAEIVTGHQDNGTNLYNGVSWTEIYGGDGADCFIDWNNNGVIVQSYVNGDFHRSTNGGASWTSILSGLTGTGAWVAPIVQNPSSANTYYCGYQHVFKSTNQGTTWTQLGSIGATLDEIKVSPSNTNVIYATSTGGVYKTINGGLNWITITGSIPSASASITDLAMDNLNPNNVYVTLSGYSASKVYASNDGGNTWTNYSTGLPNIPVNCIVYSKNSPQALYAGTDVGVYYREASMGSWIPYNTGLPNIVIDDMEIYYPTGKLRAATYARGVWETNLYSNPGAVPSGAFGTGFAKGCINIPLQFTDYSGNVPTSWNWAFPGGSPATSTLQNPLITYPSSGIYTVTLISANANGTSTPYTSTISVVNPATVAPASNSVCSGQNCNISAITNGNIVNWSTGQQGFIINVPNNTLTTVYSYTSSLGACNTAGSSTIIVDSPPQTPTIMIVGNYLTTTVVAQSYQWYLNGIPIPGETTATTTPVLPGSYLVWVANGLCESYSDAIDVNDIGIRELTAFSGITVGPNPVKDLLLVSIKSGDSEELDYEIKNNLGQLIIKSKFKTDTDKQAKLNVQFLSAGIYYLTLKKGERSNSYKFIKQ
jgi:hypothetical protein